MDYNFYYQSKMSEKSDQGYTSQEREDTLCHPSGLPEIHYISLLSNDTKRDDVIDVRWIRRRLENDIYRRTNTFITVSFYFLLRGQKTNDNEITV